VGKYNVGEVWWIHFPFGDKDYEKRRPAIVVDDDTIAILAVYVTSKDKDNPFSIDIEDWQSTGLTKPSWARIDKIVSITEWFMDRKIGNLSERDAAKILQLVAEIQTKSFHEFSLLAVQNSQGQFLQIYDERWECWLFPYTRTAEDNKSNVDHFASELLHKDIDTTYVTTAKHCKYSVSDKVYKIYNHKLYKVQIDDISDNLPGDKYKWMSIEDLESDEAIMEKNDDIIAFVKSKCL
jgi:mRNA-degrading endonuclease toxin of MazEF toxin-antitoxin module